MQRLIFLSKLNVIDPALRLFSEIAIPVYVQKEILQKEDIASEKLKALLRSNSVVVVQAKNVRMVEALCRRLGRGESEAIVLAMEQSADFVILDDHVARTEAGRIGLKVKGTLGIIRRLLDLDIVLLAEAVSLSLRTCPPGPAAGGRPAKAGMRGVLETATFFNTDTILYEHLNAYALTKKHFALSHTKSFPIDDLENA
ncbi:hypothetical protein M1O54_00835 [Dehalococcoidia bacterium]|nr:hypothetical protein [Dehalococcoidia bacterium]